MTTAVATFEPMTMTINNVSEALKAKSMLDYLINPNKYIAIADEVLQNLECDQTGWYRIDGCTNDDVYTIKHLATDACGDCEVEGFEDDAEHDSCSTITEVSVLDLAPSIAYFINLWTHRGYAFYAEANDSDTWDMEVYQGAIQIHLYGEVVYG